MDVVGEHKRGNYKSQCSPVLLCRADAGSYRVPHQANTNGGESLLLGPRSAYVANEGAVAERAKLLVGRIIIWETEMWVPEKG